MSKQYIGENEVVGIFEADDNYVKVSFKDHPELKIKRSLFDKLVTDRKSQGRNVTDMVNHYFAVKFLADLAENELGYYMVLNVATAMQTLAHNLRESLCKRTFGESLSELNLKKLLDEPANQELPQAEEVK